jgi:hypothetical protein
VLETDIRKEGGYMRDEPRPYRLFVGFNAWAAPASAAARSAHRDDEADSPAASCET